MRIISYSDARSSLESGLDSISNDADVTVISRRGGTDAVVKAAAREPFAGLGKPEPLLGNLAGYWSRRIDATHRLVYAADDVDLDVIACRGQYDH